MKASIVSGAALEKFREMVVAQGGDARVVEDGWRLPRARLLFELRATRAGFVTEVDALGVALAALRLGAGRAKAADTVDHAVGVSGLVKVGERVAAGRVLGVIHANDEGALSEVQGMLAKSVSVGDTQTEAPQLIEEIVGEGAG